ncbi:VOC family protein [Arthrobacter sp. PM3]|uniref:VOC family protein n=1 Tax=Arthrobacter sp. PM3 TaxID=2017685 RepID=UPI000E100CA6|nr:VOC family protein [Arthrobacter sp. PM3]AXJ10819.1 glyoxalase [Arthrobacter sp. PM3]
MNPIAKEIGTVFVPVSDIAESRDWYCALLGVPAEGEILFGHLYVLPMQGTGLVLDSKIYSPAAVFRVPAFHLNTADIEAAHVHLQAAASDVTEIRDNQWFTFKDPDGNVLMVCEC